MREGAEIVRIIRRHIESVEAIYLFGSQADGSATPASDVDLAMLVVAKPSGESVFQLKGELSRLLRRDVDLVDLIRADTVTAAQVVTTGQRIFALDATAADHFETTALSRYALLNEERSEIIADILATGTIYGR